MKSLPRAQGTYMKNTTPKAFTTFFFLEILCCCKEAKNCFEKRKNVGKVFD